MPPAIRDVQNRTPYWVYSNILGMAPGGTPLNVYINDDSTALPLPLVTRGDGQRAIPVDTELVIDNATVKIENLFVASRDGTLANADFMRMTAAALADGFTPPTQDIVQTQCFLMNWNTATWDRQLPIATEATALNILSALGGAGNAVVHAGRITASVTTAAYTEIASAAQISADVYHLDIFNQSGETLIIATGGAGSEVDQFYIPPGGNGNQNFDIASGTRVSVKAISANTSAGDEIIINFFS